MAYMVAAMFGMTVVVSAVQNSSGNSPRADSAKYRINWIGNDGYPSGFK